MYCIDRKRHGHEPRGVERHDDRLFDSQRIHHLLVSVQIDIGSHIIRIRVGFADSIRENMNVCIYLCSAFSNRPYFKLQANFREGFRCKRPAELSAGRLSYVLFTPYPSSRSCLARRAVESASFFTSPLSKAIMAISPLRLTSMPGPKVL